MLRSPIGSDPTPRALRAIRWTALTLLALCLPGLASAASVTFDVSDPSGYGASLMLEDGVVPGTLSIQIESTGPIVGDILGIFLIGAEPALSSLDASGPDVTGVSTFPGADPNRLVQIGDGDFWALNGISSTGFVYTDPTSSVSVASLAGIHISVWLGFDAIANPQIEGIDSFGDLTIVKAGGDIPVIPEPGTSALMMLGLIGLASASRRVKPASAA